MENVSRSVYRSQSTDSISNKVFSGTGIASKTIDVYGGGIPKFGTLAFSPSVDDYAEIFGSFRPFRASSIPLLDLPVVHEADVTFDFERSSFNYSDVFDASNSLNFAASHEELFKTSAPGGDDDSSDDVCEVDVSTIYRTPAESELSDVSDGHTYNTNSDKYWREDLDQSINMVPSGCNPIRDQLHKESFSNLQTHVSHLQSLSGIPLVDKHQYMPRSTYDFNTCNDFIRQADTPMFFRKTLPFPVNSGGNNGKVVGNSYPAAHSKDKLQVVYELPLGTGASVISPQERLLPDLLDTGNREVCDMSSHHVISTNNIPETIPGYDSPPFYDNEVNASLFVSTSAASIKEVMEKAQSKLRNAKKIMEKRKEVLQNCMRLELDTNVEGMEEEKPEFHGPINLADKKMTDSYAIKGNELGSFPSQKDKKSVISLGNDISEKVSKLNVFELSTEKNPGERPLPKWLQCCDKVGGSFEERALCEHEEKNSFVGDVLEKFDNEKYLTWTVNKCKYGTKIFVEECKISEDNDNKPLSENNTTIQTEEGNHACMWPEVTDKKTVNIFEDQILSVDEENILIVTAINLTNGNELPETGNWKEHGNKLNAKNNTMNSEEQKFKTGSEPGECCWEEEKVSCETWTRKNNDFELKIEKIKSVANETFKGIPNIPSKTQEDKETYKALKILQSVGGKQMPTIINEENKKLLVDFKFGKNKELRENGDSQSLYQRNLGKLEEYARKEDVKNIEDGCHFHERNKVEKRMEEAWIIAVKDEELENTEEVFELDENPEKCKKYLLNDAKVGLLQHQPFCTKVQPKDTQSDYDKVKMYKNGIYFVQSHENHVRLDLKCDNITGAVSHEEVGGNVFEIQVIKKLELDIGTPRVPLVTGDDAEGNSACNCSLTSSREVGLSASSRALDILRTEIFLHGSHANIPHNENMEELDDVLFAISGGKNVSIGKENEKNVGETPNSNLLLNTEIPEGVRNQKKVQHVDNTYQNIRINCNSQNIVVEDNEVGWLSRTKEMESGHRREEEKIEREREHKKDMIDVVITCEAREKRQHDLDWVSAKYQHRDAMKFSEKFEKLSPGETQNTVEFKSAQGVTAEARGQDSELKASDTSTCEAQETDKIAVTCRGYESGVDGMKSTTSFNKLQGSGYSSGFRNQNDSNYTVVGSESSRRHKARLERYGRTTERVGKALEEKNRRDLIVQQEKAERCRLAESLDADVKRWANGKEGNLRALLSTLQYILGGESGWKAVALTEVVTSVGVKKAYRKATLCVHPDKLQQRGANIHDKYISEKVFDLLKEAWNRFNSEER